MKLQIPDWLAHLLQRPVGVLGGGVSGSGAAALLSRLGAETVIYDRESQQPRRRSFGPAEAGRHGLVVSSPGFAPTHEWIRAAKSGGCEVVSETDLAALAWPGRLIGVTGTNGKTTVCEFLVHALRACGIDARAAGNIGAPLSALLSTGSESEPAPGPGTIAVCELSSFQTEGLRFFEAEASIWTNFAEDHLDRHGSLGAYFKSKYNLVRRTRDGSVFHGPDVARFAAEYGCDLSASYAVPFDGDAAGGSPAGTVFAAGPQRENFLLVSALWRRFGFQEERLVEAARSFELPAHRLAPAGGVRGVNFWNDSKATNFHAVEAAAASFDKPVVWIGGGQSKGGDIAGFVSRLAPRLRRACVIGQTRDELARHLREHATPVRTCDTLREAVTEALERSAPGDVILFSPGFSSFDMFEGYADRGRRFAGIVSELTASPGPRTEPSKKTSSKRSAQAGLCLL